MGPGGPWLRSLCEDGGTWSQWKTLLIQTAHYYVVYKSVLDACNTGPQTGSLKKAEIHPAPGPGDQTSEVKVSQGCAPSRSPRGGSFLPLPASGGFRGPWACGRHPHPRGPHLRPFTSIRIIKNDLFISRSFISYICQDPFANKVISIGNRV